MFDKPTFLWTIYTYTYIDPYNIFKIFNTNEIVEYMVKQTNVYAEQVLK